MELALAESAIAEGFGTLPDIGATSCGLVPHVTVGAMSSALMITSLSYLASESLDNVRQ